MGRAGAFDVPDDADERAARLEPVDDARPWSRCATALRRTPGGDVEPVDVGRPNCRRDSPPTRCALGSEAAIVDEVAAAGPDALLVDPPGLRARVIERLREVAA